VIKLLTLMNFSKRTKTPKNIFLFILIVLAWFKVIIYLKNPKIHLLSLIAADMPTF
jgi:hypothetical protein